MKLCYLLGAVFASQCRSFTFNYRKYTILQQSVSAEDAQYACAAINAQLADICSREMLQALLKCLPVPVFVASFLGQSEELPLLVSQCGTVRSTQSGETAFPLCVFPEQMCVDPISELALEIVKLRCARPAAVIEQKTEIATVTECQTTTRTVERTVHVTETTVELAQTLQPIAEEKHIEQIGEGERLRVVVGGNEFFFDTGDDQVVHLRQ